MFASMQSTKRFHHDDDDNIGREEEKKNGKHKRNDRKQKKPICDTIFQLNWFPQSLVSIFVCIVGMGKI